MDHTDPSRSNVRLNSSPCFAVRIAALLLLTGSCAFAQYEPPADYYDTATGTGSTLMANLNVITGRNYWVPGSTTHLVRSYDSARQSLHILHRDPNNAANIILIYNGVSVSGAWDAGITWNREHTWPDSRGLGGSGMDYTDLHQLRPCNPNANSSRGNRPFGAGSASYWDPQPSTNPYFGPTTYVPGTNDRGEMARTMFYMDVRYDGADSGTTNLTLVNGFPSGSQMGDLAQLLAWHYEDPVNDTERLRNHLIFSNSANPSYYQGNRNPFVDRPEFVWAIWGIAPNDSTLSVATPEPDGSSTTDVSIRVIVGTNDAQSFTLTKSGTYPTTFNATLTGPFSVSGVGQGLAFPYGAQSREFWVMPDSVATTGLFSGTIVIDNTDLTTAAAGKGSADGDDIVILTTAVLNPSVPSTNDAVLTASITIETDLDADSGVQTIQVPISNFGFDAEQSFMDIDAISGGGAFFSIIDGATTGIGAAPAFITLGFDTDAAGNGLHTADFTVHTSDEDIAGETTDSVTVRWEITLAPPPPLCEGDANGDLLVNFADISTILTFWGSGPGAADANGDGSVNFGDISYVLTFWGADCN